MSDLIWPDIFFCMAYNYISMTFLPLMIVMPL